MPSRSQSAAYVRKSFTVGTPCCAELGVERDADGPGRAARPGPAPGTSAPGNPERGTASAAPGPAPPPAGHLRARPRPSAGNTRAPGRSDQVHGNYQRTVADV